MELSDRTKVLILVAIIAIVIYLFIQSNSDDTTHNEGSLKQNGKVESNEDDVDDLPENIQTQDTEQTDDAPKKRFSGKYMGKFKTRNTSPEGQFAYSSYADGKRGGRSSDLGKFFEEGHPLDEKVGFTRNDMDDKFARYVPGKPKKMKDVDKFDVDKMLPHEKNKDWFDDPYESSTVKNSHLINVYRPIGVNTVSTTLKNPSHDIRGTPPNPKTVISPFLNSSYEPDTNLRNQALCY
jgi:hypothetical protein